MINNHKQGLVPAEALTAKEWREAEQLVATGNQYEGLDLPISPERPASAEEDRNQFFYYEQGRLVGFAALQEGRELEACGVVHPNDRRRGIGRALLRAVQAEARGRGWSQLLLVCDDASASGRAFVAAVGAQPHSAEYQMVLDPAVIDRSRPRPEGLQFQPAGAEETELLISVQQAAFGDPEEVVRAHLSQGLRQPTRQYFIARLQGKPIGLLRLGRYDRYADITTFGVLPAYRGRGYGRQMLLESVDLLLAEGWPQILIDVATDNRRALGLYQSCGFKVARTYGFYSLDLLP